MAKRTAGTGARPARTPNAAIWREDPRDVRPMLAELAPPEAHFRLLRNERLIFEPKYDGIRALVALDGPAPPAIYTRLGRNKTPEFPDLFDPLRRLARRLRRPVLLDGEVVATGDDGAPLAFQYLQDRLQRTGAAAEAAALKVPVALILFDLLREGDEDLRPLPCHERRKRLERLLRGRRRDLQLIRLADSQVGDGEALAADGEERGWEGVIAKQPASRYSSGRRSAQWQKLKFTSSEDFVVGGWTAPRGSRRHIGALLLGYYPADRRWTRATPLIFAGQVGSGFTDAELDRLASRLTPLVTESSPFAEVPAPHRPEKRGWVKPELVARVAFTQWTRDGILRNPVYHGLRDDVRPAAVRHDDQRPDTGPPPSAPRRRVAPEAGPEPAAADLLAELNALEASRRKGTLVLAGGARVPVGNLHKVFWPEPELTKGDLLRYYLRVAPYLLPVVAGRPLVMKRFPNGVDGKSFYQHRAPDPIPDGARVAIVAEKLGAGADRSADSEVPYLIGGQLQTLIYMAQLAVISQDPWFSTLDRITEADMTALDLDPMPDAPFTRVLDVARWLHDELERLGVPSFAKTSGSEGLHIFIPLPAGTPYEAGMIFCQIVATVVAARHPEAATVERTVRRRPADAVYIDTLQNIYGKTLACAYSARASPFAGVSAPLTWAEVHDGPKSGLQPRDFTMRSIHARLDEVGDLWAGTRSAAPANLEDALAKLEAAVSGG
ncbi:MAG: DNA ligase D [Acidobacteria bacterium]|nr:DNA ligase D [Acidobacteriota bacterium]MYJ05721.1 DNA ligase D [Acidobacteriota bacterium]